MKTVIVAAGMARRLREVTKGKPKPLMEIGGKSLLMRSIETLSNFGYGPFVVVTGYKQHELKKHIGDLATCIFNPWFETTNNMTSLWFAKHWVNSEPFAYLHADLLYHPEIIYKMSKHKNNTVMLYDSSSIGEEEMKLIVDNGNFVCSDKSIPLDEADGEWLGINQFSAEDGALFFEMIESCLEKKNFENYDTFALNKMADAGVKLPVEDIVGLPWLEIDFPEDLDKAEKEILPQIQEI